MARLIACVLLALFACCLALDNEFIYFKYQKKISKNTINNVVTEITDAILGIPELEQLMHSWYRIFVRKDKVDFMLKQSTNIFKGFLGDILESYVDETLEEEEEGEEENKTNRSLTVGLSMSLNKTNIIKSTELLNLFNHQNKTKTYKATCNTQKSLQQTFVEVFKTHVGNSSRNFFTLVLSYEDPDIDDNPMQEIQPFELKKNSAMSVILAELLSQVSREVWRCDPEVHVKGVTYENAESMRQIAIVNSKFIGSEYSNDCTNYRSFDPSMSTYVTQISVRYGFGYTHNYQELRLFSCENIDSSVSICLADTNAPNGRIIERPENCLQKPLTLLSNVRHCLCTYSNYTEPQTFINVAPIMADVDRNYVVTGARLKRDMEYSESMAVLTIEIQQGRLEANGYINESTIEWKKPDSKYYVLDSFHYHSYTMSLIELAGQRDEVMVGVQFAEAEGRSAFLKPLLVKFDFASGVLNHRDAPSSPESKDLDASCRKSVQLKSADVPTLAKQPSLPESACAKVTFGPSSFKTDRGQTTIPFLDVQEVSTSPPSPLSGASLYYKSTKGFGGFVGLKLLTYNTAEHLIN